MSGRALLYVQRARTQLAVDQQLNPLEQIVRGQRRNTCGRKIADAEFERFARGFPIRDVSFALSFAFALPQPRQLRIELPDGAAGSNPARVIGDADTRAEPSPSCADSARRTAPERAVPDINTAGASPGLQASAVSAPCLFESRNWRMTECLRKCLRGTTG